jgi:hypothetical protein
MNLSSLSGWTPHRTFGLRAEWLALYLRDPVGWRETTQLGPVQIVSLGRWLLTGGVVEHSGKETVLARLFRERGLGDPLPWELFWANTAFAWPTARWYVSRLGLGEWTSAELCRRLLADVPRLAERTARDATVELVGLFAGTPIGRELGQGEVSGRGPRLVRRAGLPHPHAEALVHALELLFAECGRERLGYEEELLWPWVIFGSRREEALFELSQSGASGFRVREQWVERA